MLLAIGLASGVAILVTPLPVLVQIPGWLLVATWLARCWQQIGLHRVLHHHGGVDHAINQWTFVEQGKVAVQGKLIHKGYRSAGLLILTMEDEETKQITRIPVWRDSVSADAFSYLNLQLMFNTSKP